MRLRRNGKEILYLPLPSDGLNCRCVECGTGFDTEDHRRMADVCTHEKCLACLLKKKEPCKQCPPASTVLQSSTGTPPTPGKCGKPPLEPDPSSIPLPSDESSEFPPINPIKLGKENVAAAPKKCGFKCYSCGDKFPSRASLAVHLDTHRRDEPKTPRSISSIEKRKRSSLGDSTSMFTIVRKRASTVVPKKLSTRSKPVRKRNPSKLKEHIYGVKKGKRGQRKDLLWTCHLCDTSFYLFQQLQLHKKMHLINFQLSLIEC